MMNNVACEETKVHPSIVYQCVVSLAVCVLSLGLAGCGGTSPTANQTITEDSASRAKKVDTETHSVATDRATVTQSPASPASEYDDAVATPERACQQFMKRLQTGDRIGAENLLTRVALSVTSRENLRLEPMSGPDAQCKILPARYATTNHKLAQVDCQITEVIDSKNIQSEITWVVRRQESGWRISGILLELEAGKAKDLLSFESMDDVATIKMLASGIESTAERASRQAAASTDKRTLQ